jgi:hypothetical protein
VSAPAADPRLVAQRARVARGAAVVARSVPVMDDGDPVAELDALVAAIGARL